MDSVWKIDPKGVKQQAIDWIRNYFVHNGFNCSAVIGISGGKDSTVAAALCVEALGNDRVVGVMMPNGDQADIADSIRVCELLDIPHMTINIKAAYDKMAEAIGGGIDISEQALVNLAPRLRMATLYAVAQSLPKGGRVANTCNFSEDYVGYATKFGDSAGDFGVLSYLNVDQVKALGYELGLPADLVDKTPFGSSMIISYMAHAETLKLMQKSKLYTRETCIKYAKCPCLCPCKTNNLEFAR